MVGLVQLHLESIPGSDMHHRPDSSPQLLSQDFSLPGSQIHLYPFITMHSIPGS